MPTWTCKACRTDGEDARKDEVAAGVADRAVENSITGAAGGLAAPVELIPCMTCKESLPRSQYDACFTGRAKSEWRCESCRYPTCRRCGLNGPKTGPPAQSRTKQDKLSYRCDACTYPPCSSCCRTTRPVTHRSTKYYVDNMPFWFCDKVRCQAAKRRNKKQEKTLCLHAPRAGGRATTDLA